MSAPVIIIGAARSGTKFLRDTLGADERARIVPHDVNFIWRRGNENLKDDLLPPSLADDATCRRIRSGLGRAAGIGRGDEDGVLVEKTVSNCLRIPFIERVLPGARYVHLVRDGREVAESAMRQWLEPPDWRRLLVKLRCFSPADWRYLAGFAANAVAGRLAGRGGGHTWGPRYPGIDEDVASLDLAAICARQWRRCVEAAHADLAAIDPARRIEVRYEELVAGEDAIRRVCAFAGLDGDRVAARHGKAVRHGGASGFLTRLDPARQAMILDEAGPLLGRLGYR